MEKWQEEYQYLQLQKQIDARGTEFLNDILNMRGDFEKVNRDFTRDILRIDGNNKYAIDKINEYFSVADMLRYTFGLYRSNVDYFGTQVLQVNSVISTSLTIEYRIHDILFNKDFLLKSNKLSDIEKINEAIETLEAMRTKQQEIFDEPIPKTYTEAERLHFMTLQDRVKEETDNLLEAFKQQLADAKTQREKNNNRIQEFKKNEYYIGTLSKDKNLISMFRGILLDYVTNDIIEGVRETFFKKYKVKIENRTPRAERVHCTKVGAFKITQNKIADLMRLSLLNESGNVIDKKTLDLFTLFIDLEEQTKTAEYKELLKKYIKIASKEMEKEKKRKADLLACCVMNNAEALLQEKGWCDFE